jgi:hypothetical protein
MTTPTPDALCKRLRLISKQADVGYYVMPADDAVFILQAADLIQQQQATIERLSAELEDAPNFVQRAFVAGFLAHMRNERADPFNEWEASEIRKESTAIGKDASDV